MALNLFLCFFLHCGYGSKMRLQISQNNVIAVILLPLHFVSLTHKNPKRHKIIRETRPVGPNKIIHEICPVGCKENSIDFKIFR